MNLNNVMNPIPLYCIGVFGRKKIPNKGRLPCELWTRATRGDKYSTNKGLNVGNIKKEIVNIVSPT